MKAEVLDSNHYDQQLSDAELVLALSRGDEQALASLYDRYGATLFGLLFRILKSRVEAEDILQEVFLYLWQHAKDFDEKRGRVFTWLVTISHSRAIDRLRAINSRDRTVIRAAEEPNKDFSDPSDDAIRLEQKARILGALERVPEGERQVLLLAYFDGLSQTEIAARTGAPLGTVKTRTRAGLRKLQTYLLENT